MQRTLERFFLIDILKQPDMHKIDDRARALLKKHPHRSAEIKAANHFWKKGENNEWFKSCNRFSFQKHDGTALSQESRCRLERDDNGKAEQIIGAAAGRVR